jgi:hypothetical protein
VLESGVLSPIIKPALYVSAVSFFRQFQNNLVWFSFIFLAASQPCIEATERNLPGHKIFAQQCARCHGRNGEGIKGKYDETLHGDWSIEKLTRYIDKNMPDDNPGKCTPEDAEAAARYIYDTFYSLEARLRSNPPRVELARLTNRQYVNAVADLIKHFTGSDGAPAGEQGLRATYYSSKDFNGDKKVTERIDRQIDFDFGENNPDQEHYPTNEFSIQWHGSLVADESGEYQFILKTSNGVRLWINDDNEPLIDEWVSSGQPGEYKTTVRLIGGRIYPLKLNFFKYKDKTASVSLQWKPPHGAQQLVPARNFSTARSSSTFVVTTPFPADDSSVGYERGISVSKAWDEATTQAAIETANFVVKNLDNFCRTKLTDTNHVARIQEFCAEFVATAFRRPLTEEQKRLFVSRHFKKGVKTEDTAKRVLLLALKSPQFLYFGLNTHKPGDFEVAERLSFALWDSLPDDHASKLAAKYELHTPTQISKEARRMLNDPRARAKMQAFFHHWLQMDRAENLSKDGGLFPGFTPETIADLRTSLNLWLEDVVWNNSSDYRKLLLDDHLFLNKRLAEFYGVTTNATDDFVKVKVDSEERSGVLTHPYLLAAFSYQKQTSPIHRGVFLTRNIVGRALKPPPMAQVFNNASFAPHLTMREKVAELTKPQNCQSCHSVINPLGFSLESYDAVGRLRSSENGKPIDTVSDYVTDNGETVRLDGARDVATFALNNEHAQNMFVEQLFHSVVKQPLLAYGSDVPKRLRQSFVASDFNLQKLLVEIVTISASYHR